MQKALLRVLAVVTLASGPAFADVLEMPEGEPSPAIMLPTKSMSMVDVEKKYGAPRTKHPTVGGGAPRQPPITRWDYAGFTVIFERDKVVDAVIPGAPPKLHKRHELKPALPAAAPEPAPLPPAAVISEPPVAAEPVAMPEPSPEPALEPALEPATEPVAAPAMEAVPQAGAAVESEERQPFTLELEPAQQKEPEF